MKGNKDRDSINYESELGEESEDSGDEHQTQNNPTLKRRRPTNLSQNPR